MVANKPSRRLTVSKRDIFREMEGVAAMKSSREGKIMLRTHKLEPASCPKVNSRPA
jgi:hypothetical protein